MIKDNGADCVTIAKFKEKHTYQYIYKHIHLTLCIYFKCSSVHGVKC